MGLTIDNFMTAVEKCTKRTDGDFLADEKGNLYIRGKDFKGKEVTFVNLNIIDKSKPTKCEIKPNEVNKLQRLAKESFLNAVSDKYGPLVGEDASISFRSTKALTLREVKEALPSYHHVDILKKAVKILHFLDNKGQKLINDGNAKNSEIKKLEKQILTMKSGFLRTALSLLTDPYFSKQTYRTTFYDIKSILAYGLFQCANKLEKEAEISFINDILSKKYPKKYTKDKISKFRKLIHANDERIKQNKFEPKKRYKTRIKDVFDTWKNNYVSDFIGSIPLGEIETKFDIQKREEFYAKVDKFLTKETIEQGKNFSADQKKNFLLAIFNEYMNTYDLNNVNLVYKTIESDDDGMFTSGKTRYEDNKINVYIHDWLLTGEGELPDEYKDYPFSRLLSTLVHECRHAYQMSLLNDLDKIHSVEDVDERATQARLYRICAHLRGNNLISYEAALRERDAREEQSKFFDHCCNITLPQQNMI